VVLYYGHVLFGVEKDGIVHLTLVFNVFVLCQLFNELNARRIYDELNIFEGFFTNTIFIGVLAFTVLMQIFLVQYGGEWTSTHPLSSRQWLACFALRAVSLPLGFVLRLVKVDEPPKTALEPPQKRSPSAMVAKWKNTVHKAAAKVEASAKVQKNTLFSILHGGKTRGRSLSSKGAKDIPATKKEQ